MTDEQIWIEEQKQIFITKEKEFRFQDKRPETIELLHQFETDFSMFQNIVEEDLSLIFNSIIHLKTYSKGALLYDILRMLQNTRLKERVELRSLSPEDNLSFYKKFEKRIRSFPFKNLSFFLNQRVYTKKERLQSLFDGVYIEEEKEVEIKVILQNCLFAVFQFVFSQISYYELIIRFSSLFEHTYFKPYSQITLCYERIFSSIPYVHQEEIIHVYRKYVKQNNLFPSVKEKLFHTCKPRSFSSYRNNSLYFFEYNESLLEELSTEITQTLSFLTTEIEELHSLRIEESRPLKSYISKFESLLVLQKDIDDMIKQNKNAS